MTMEVVRERNIKHGRQRNKPTDSGKKLPDFGKNLSEYFYDYSNNSSIQGIKYLTEKNRSSFEKLFWLVFLSVSIGMCAYLLNGTYNKWQNAPVIVAFSNKLVPVWEIPFPAVTFCPEAKSKRSLYNYSDIRNKLMSKLNITEEERKHFAQISVLCFNARFKAATLENDTIDFLFNIAPSCEEWKCTWNDNVQPCNKILTPVITDEGVCFSFNMLDREEVFTSANYQHRYIFKHGIKSTNWSLEKGYAKGVGAEDYPRRAIAGSESFHIVMVTREPELDYGCRAQMQGYKGLLHHPAEIPTLQNMAFIASFDKQTQVTIKPQMMTTSPDLEGYDPQQRLCYFAYERQLKYFQVYTQSNCELECLTNQTLKHCDCVAYYMPRDITTNICGRGKSICMTDAKEIMITKERRTKNASYNNEPQERCDCLPSCTSLTYDTETSDADNKWRKRLEARNEPRDESDLILTEVSFSFKAQYVITTERKELYGLTDFIANCGGLLGLFVGFCFLSVVEIIYFLTVRPTCNIRKHGLHFWSGPPEFPLEFKA